MQTTAITNARVLTSHGWRDDVAVIVADGRISALIARDEVPAAARQHDLAGRMLLPGFIDCQVNGGGGVLFNDQTSLAGIRAIGAAHRRFGTTGFLPTLISDTIDKMRAAVAAAAAASSVPGVLGIHLEGPFISRERRGVHDARFVHAPVADELDVAASLQRGKTLLTLAPERVAPDAIGELADRGVIVALGHSDADSDQVRTALAAGARGFTHLFNAMSPLTSRAPGMVGAALDDQDSWCGVIVDGHHVAPASLRIALRAKPRGKIFLVTDAMPPVGAADPSYVLNDETITARDGICQTAGGTLAGSALSMIDAVRNTVEMLGVPLEEAVRMAATYPADFLGLGASHGRIETGCRADFTVIDAQWHVTETWINGEVEAT